MTVDRLALELAATFDHVPSEVYTSKGATGRMCCGNCFVDWPCAVVRKIERVMVAVVDRIANERAAAELQTLCEGPPWNLYGRARDRIDALYREMPR